MVAIKALIFRFQSLPLESPERRVCDGRWPNGRGAAPEGESCCPGSGRWCGHPVTPSTQALEVHIPVLKASLKIATGCAE